MKELFVHKTRSTDLLACCQKMKLDLDEGHAVTKDAAVLGVLKRWGGRYRAHRAKA